MIKKIPIIDAHEDISTNILYSTNKNFFVKNKLHQGSNSTGFAINNNSDLPRLLQGNVKLVFASIFSVDNKLVVELEKERPENYNFSKVFKIKTDLAGALEQIALYHDTCNSSNALIHIKNIPDYLKTNKKVGMLFHLEGVDYFHGSIEMLETFYNLGVRSIALTWRNSNKFAAGNNSSGGLTNLGKKLISKVASMPIILDLAHSNSKTFWDVAKIAKFPLIVSHTLCKAITDNTRNLDDDQIKAIAKTNGVICLAAIPDFIGGDTIEDYVKHFIHIKNLVGIDYIGFGTDFDGLIDHEDRFVKNFDDVSKFPNVIEELKKNGFTKLEIEKICYKNLERVIISRLQN